MDPSSFPRQPARVDSGGGEMPPVSHTAASPPDADASGGDLPLATWQTAPVFADAGGAAFLDHGPYASQGQGLAEYPRPWVPPWVLMQPQGEVMLLHDELFHAAEGSSFEPTPYGTSHATSPPESPPAFDVLPFSVAQAHDTAVIRSDDMGGIFDHGSVQPSPTNLEFPVTDAFVVDGSLYTPAADFFTPMVVHPHMFDIPPVYPTGVEPILEQISTGHTEIPRVATPPPVSPPVIDLTLDSPLPVEHRMLDCEVILPAVDSRSAQPSGSRRMPPRELELRVMTEAEIARLSPGERRKIYVSSMERHVDALYSAALAISRYDCNRDRIAQLADVDTRTVKTTTTLMQEELNRLRDRRDALRARNVALRAGTALRPSSPPHWP